LPGRQCRKPRSLEKFTERISIMVKVLVVGQTPPPYLGLPIMLECLVRSEMQDVDLHHLRIVLSKNESQVGKFSASKLLRLLKVIAQIYYARFVHAPQIMYFAPAAASKMSMIRDVAILGSTRFLFPKTILHYHASGHCKLYETLPRWQKWLFRRAFFQADGAIRLSSFTPDDSKQLEAVREYIVPNGIDDPAAEGLPRRTTFAVSPSQPLRLLFIALLCEAKGLLILIEACGKLAARGVPFQLNVMGRFESEEFEARVRRRVAELQIEDRVTFLGVLTGADKFAVFHRSDVLCHPTYFDTFPVVLLEAMGCGIPVVASCWSGIPSIVDDGRTGFLVGLHDPDGVADRVAQLAEDPQLRQRMGAAGRDKFLHEFTLPRHIERMRQVFLSVGGQSDECDAIETPQSWKPAALETALTGA
jgi:glycosyltransferase involved in cell wall biosynthesis